MNQLLQLILETTWLFLPAVIANIAPVFAARYNWLPAFNLPIDNGVSFRGVRLLGDNKTWRGLVVGIIIGSTVGILQGSPVVGLLLSAGALIGDATKSFFKRQLKIAPGKSWVPFDQIDYILGALLIAGWFMPLTSSRVITAVIMFSLGSYLVSLIGVKLKIKKSL